MTNPVIINAEKRRRNDPRAQIAAAMDILDEIPGETLDERLRNLCGMIGRLEAEWRKLNDRRATTLRRS
jgi:hypothetical protein